MHIIIIIWPKQTAAFGTTAVCISRCSQGGRCNIVTFGKKLCVIFLSKFQNPASITLCTNVLSVYQAQNYCKSPQFPLETNSQGYNTKVYMSFPGMNKFLF